MTPKQIELLLELARCVASPKCLELADAVEKQAAPLLNLMSELNKLPLSDRG